MKSFTEQISDLKESIELRLTGFAEANEKYHSEYARLRELYFGDGFRADVAEKKAEDGVKKIKMKIEALDKELEIIIKSLEELTPLKIRDKKNSITAKFSGSEGGETVEADRKRTQGVLIVDDAAFMREVISTTLSNDGIAIAGEAESGRSALEKYKEILPELVLLDIKMPDGDGFHALKSIKQYDKDAKVVMCSQISKQDTVDEAIKLGARGYIAKPFKPETLNSVVRKALESK